MTAFHQKLGQLDALAAKQLFFIGGSMKSGTSWLRLLLDAHPRIACTGEGHVTNNLAQMLLTSLERHNETIHNKNRVVFNEMDGFPLYDGDDLTYLIGSALLLAFAKIGQDKDLCAIGEKTPDNVRHFELLHKIFPAAKFLIVVRDGRDCAVSGWFHNLRTGNDRFINNYPCVAKYAAMFAREWAKDIACGEYFARDCPQSCLTVRYEALLADTEAVMRDVLDFLGAPADPNAVSQCCGSATFQLLTGGRAPGEENRQSFFRNGTEGNWREHLDEAASQAFATTAAPWLQQLGYH